MSTGAFIVWLSCISDSMHYLAFSNEFNMENVLLRDKIIHYVGFRVFALVRYHLPQQIAWELCIVTDPRGSCHSLRKNKCLCVGEVKQQ